MKTIYLIRHGKASLDGSERERGLTDEGVEHAKQITEILKKLEPKIEKVYSSPLRRAILTIEPFAKTANLEINVVEDLKEKITGDTTGKDLNGGESSKDATDRALSGLKHVFDNLPENGSAAVQCHGTLIALILHHYDSSFGFDQWKSMTMPDIYQIDHDENQSKIIHIGCENIETFKIGDK